MKRVKKLLLTILTLLFLTSLACASPQNHPRYIFLFIGDGMGLAQTAAAELYLNALKHDSDPSRTTRELPVASFPVTGLMTTYSADDYITDSAAAGTAMASGTKAENGYFSQGKRGLLPEHFMKKGYRTAILTSVPADHATPAAFYSRSLSRKDYYNIALEMMDSPVDIIAGAYVLGNRPRTREGRPDLFQENLKRVRVSLSGKKISWPADKETKVLLIPDEEMGQFPYAIDKPDNVMLEKAFLSIIGWLEKDSFFFVIEGGNIDWACHNNDIATVVHEVVAYNQVIGKAVEFYRKHPGDTLILVTGDHETGGLALGSEEAGSLFPAMIREQTASSEMMAFETKESRLSFEDVVKNYFGDDFYRFIVEKGNADIFRTGWEEACRGDDFSLRYTFFEGLTRLFAARAGFSWGTGGHSGSPVPVWAMGKGSAEFTGLYDNTELYEKILKLIP